MPKKLFSQNNPLIEPKFDIANWHKINETYLKDNIRQNYLYNWIGNTNLWICYFLIINIFDEHSKKNI